MTDHSDPPLSKPEQFKALAHPLRQRMLFVLGEREETVSRLATILDTHKGNIAHHLKVLVAAGIVEQAGSRKVRGGTEYYYRRSIGHVAIEEARPGPAEAMLRAVSTEFTEAPGDPLLAVRHLRLTEAQARRLHDELFALAYEAEEAEEGEARYGILVGLYRRPSMPEPE